MSFFAPEKPSPIDQRQSRLLQIAALFLLIYSVILSLSPAVRLHTWEAPYRWNHWAGFGVWLIGTVVVSQQLCRHAPDRDPFLFPIAAMLSGWGLLEVWRLDATMGLRQTVWLAVSLGAFTTGLRLPGLLAFLQRYKYVWLTGGLLLTMLTFLLGTYPGGVGPRLWLGCCGLYLQPSEPLKLLLIIYLSAYLADRLPVSFGLVKLLTPTLVLIGAALALLIAQKDLGTASLFILIYSIVVFLASQRRRTIVISSFTLLSAGAMGYLLFDVVRIRVDAWLNPWLDPSGRSYQIVQSIIAVASGGLLGRGPGLGSPGVVPVAHSDFIFASIAEETGLLGAVGLLGLFALLLSRGFRAALFAPNTYRRYLAAGVTAYLVMQAIFIAGGNLRLLPLTGVTLPFVSYGGSSLLTAFLSTLILVLVSNRSEDEEPAFLRPGPYLFVSTGLLIGLLALAVIAGWWAFIRRDALLSRTDNPRWVVSDRFVRRGSLLDRQDRAISMTEGTPGTYARRYVYPPLALTTGYNSQLYSLAGLEAGLDPYLRGIEGSSADDRLLADLIYGQPPPGRDIRLTIQLELQKAADVAMNSHRGALVLLDARTGDILAIASHPYFDPNNLDNTWDQLIADPSAPLLNRATQGQYPPGATVGPFLAGLLASSGDTIPMPPDDLSYRSKIATFTCAETPDQPASIAEGLSLGCPGIAAELGKIVGKEQVNLLFEDLGWYRAPAIPIPAAEPAQPSIEQVELAAIGQENLTVTPLQMALAAAAITSGGMQPAPRLVDAVLTSQSGWQTFSTANSRETMLSGGTDTVMELLADPQANIWQAMSLAATSDAQITWYIGGSLPEYKGTPLALALVLEENNPALAEQIGQAVLSQAQR